MTNRRWLVFPIALLLWALVFYGMDQLVMTSQGLPVAMNLMPK